MRRVVLETSANAKKAAAEEDDPEDLVLRAKELKTQIKLANAEEAIAEADEKSASASARAWRSPPTRSAFAWAPSSRSGKKPRTSGD